MKEIGLYRCNKNIVINNKISLIRNISNVKFSYFLSEKEAIALSNNIIEKIEKIEKYKFKVFKIREESREMIGQYLEKQMITDELFNNKDSGVFLYDEYNEILVILNEGNHIKISGIGMDLLSIYRNLDKFDDELAKKIDIAFDEQLGFLSMHKNDLGTAMKICTRLHLPALSHKKMIDDLVTNFKKIDINLKGIFGEGKDNGDIYEISNIKSLGFSERELIGNIEAVTNEIILREKKVRDEMLREKNLINELEDEIFRAVGILSYAREITLKEAINLLSKVRLGIEFNIIKEISLKTIDRLIEKIQYYNLKIISKNIFNEKEEKSLRAKLIREELNGRA